MLKNLTGTCNQLNRITKYIWKFCPTIDNMFQILDGTEYIIMSMINCWVDNNKSHIKVRIFMFSNIIIEKL